MSDPADAASANLDAIRRAYKEVKGSEPAKLGLDTELRAELGIDSLDMFEIGMILEESGAVAIDAKHADSLRTIGDVLALFSN